MSQQSAIFAPCAMLSKCSQSYTICSATQDEPELHNMQRYTKCSQSYTIQQIEAFPNVSLCVSTHDRPPGIGRAVIHTIIYNYASIVQLEKYPRKVVYPCVALALHRMDISLGPRSDFLICVCFQVARIWGITCTLSRGICPKKVPTRILFVIN